MSMSLLDFGPARILLSLRRRNGSLLLRLANRSPGLGKGIIRVGLGPLRGDNPLPRLHNRRVRTRVSATKGPVQEVAAAARRPVVAARGAAAAARGDGVVAAGDAVGGADIVVVVVGGSIVVVVVVVTVEEAVALLGDGLGGRVAVEEGVLLLGDGFGGGLAAEGAEEGVVV
jgi:hypothetical protein